MRRFSWYAFLTDEVAGMAYDRLGEDASAEGVKLQYHQQVLKLGTDEELTLSGYCRAFCKMFVFYFISLVTLGIPFLLVYWKPEWGVFWKRRRCALMEADMLIIKDLDGQIYVSSVDSEMVEAGFPSKYIISSHLTNGASNGVHNGASDSTHLTQPRHRIIRYFIFQHIKYIWIPDKLSFERLYGCDSNTSISSLLNDFRGYTVQEQMQRQQLFGRNAISVEVKSYFHLLVTEVLNPFYIFQIASIILWSFDNYVLYATCIFLVSCLSVAVSLYETRKQSQSLHDMVEASNTNTATVLRSTIEKTTVEVEVNTVDLVPGDVLVIPATGCLMACDAVLISGNAIVNESMLTGESVPVTKTPVTTSEGNETYSAEKHKRHTLFCGTAVIQTRYYGNAQVLAVVVRTGFSTAKGELVRSILYPRPLDFKFYKDSMKFILFMFGIASLGMSYSIYIYIMHKETILKTVVRTLDIVTIVVPPALPAAMTVGTYYAQSRLKQKGIFCISPPRINVSGKLKLVCFDKTGTLTEDGLEVWGVVEAKGDQLSTPVMDISTLDHTSQLVAGLATCHSLTYVHGELTGDPLDVKMFESTKWELEEPEEDDTQRFDNLIPTLVRPPKCPVHHPSPAPAPVPHSSSSSPPPAPLCPPSSSPPPRSSLSPSPVPPSPPPPSPSVPCTSTPHIESEVTASVCHETTCTSVVPHTAASDGCDSDFVPQGVGLIEQVPYELGIVRQFPFSSSTQRMSVLVRVLGRSYMDLYAKGAPEVIQSLCRPESIPEDLGPILTQYTVQGFRVIALAHRTLETKLSWHAAQRIPRDQVECDLNFVGLLILQNMLKPETAPVIRQLKAANIRTVMVTGDNILTGISVARDCGMVGETDHVLLAKVTAPSPEHPASLTFEPADTPDILVQYSDDVDNKYTCMNMGDGNPRYHLAVTGKAWALLCQYFPDLVPRIVARGTVFARMSPDQKAQLVEELQAIDYVVGMCGDGANDCGALKAAHVGISLSEAEASVAAPFTSHTDNIQCVPQVICEGRCALTTNFSVFKYMALYSIIQFVSVLILYTAYSNLTDPQFLYIDLFIVTVIAVFMGYTGARHELVAKKPLGNLLGAVNMFSVLSQITLVILTQVIAYLYLLQQPWFEPNKPTPGNEEDNTVSWETATIFYVSAFQYLTLCIAYSPGRPFRQPIYTNFWLTVSLVSLTVITLVMLLCPWSWLMQLMKIRYDPENNLMMFRVALLLVIALHFVVSLSTEHFVARSRILKNCFQWITCKREPKNKYKIVLRDMDEDSSWPPIATPIYATLHT
ncbi:polyamine-transporting ATPase 13A3-like isoform X5 [Penaeus japonicus]|uniref:polyamine-transporting ATPase 13A3-like isoform X5 n=1 Tax=Penaeus japonicus TaxID=27405 RepID=UPI001C70EA5E|nr:polyamine-transporting ATPase 13A3-like isoform X5 [Penaeus japonicus]